MKNKIESIWDAAIINAAQNPIEQDAYRLTLIENAKKYDLYAGIDSKLDVLLAIGIQNRPPNIEIESDCLDYFRQQRNDGSWLAVLRLVKSDLAQVFAKLCYDLVSEASEVSSEKRLMYVFHERVRLWAQLFQRSGNGLLARHEVMGLIAELIVLERLLKHGTMEALEIVTGWVGPLGSDQDFQYSTMAFEVKAISQGNPTVTISSLEQLSCEKILHLVVIGLEKASSSTQDIIVSLNMLVARIEGLIATDPITLKVFRDRLRSACYIEHEYYDSILFALGKAKSYRVEGKFPRLTNKSVPKGIATAKYSLKLETIGDFAIVEPWL